MKGYFRVYDDKKLLAEFPNMITNSGQIAIGRYLAGQRVSWGDVMAFGSGDSAPSQTNTELDFEFWRDEVDLKIYNGPTAIPANKLILRSTVPTRISGKIYELGIYCTLTPNEILQFGPLITSFDPDKEPWSGGTVEDENFRIGESSVILEGGESATLQYFGDFRSYDSSTYFKLAYSTVGSPTSVTIKIKSNDENYKSYTFTPETGLGYFIEKWGFFDFVQTGNPDWKEFSQIEVSVVGAGSVVFDGLSAYQSSPDDFRTVLVSRALVNVDGESFIDKTSDRELQVEYLVDLGA